MVTATADGTFYIAWNDMHETLQRFNGNLDGGVAVSKSTDGGLTWSQPVLTGTPIDRPWLVSDLSTGTIYEASGEPPLFGLLGPGSTGDADAPLGTIADRWLAASQDGVHWTTPQRFGGGGVPGFPGADADTIAAAHGVLAATFRSTDAAACTFFVSATAPCTVFQMTTDAGVTWSRHRVSVPSDSTGTVLVAANPAAAGRYAIAVLNSAGTEFLVYRTADGGNTWSGPTVVTEDNTKVHFKPRMAYSPHGVLGLMWRTNQPGPGPTFPYNVWAAITDDRETSDDNRGAFSEPLEVSTADSPAPDPTQLAVDDFSFLTLDREDLFVAWADWRPGEMSGFFSAVKLQAFRHRERS
jgi:hypothetical protein